MDDLDFDTLEILEQVLDEVDLPHYLVYKIDRLISRLIKRIDRDPS